MHTRLKPLKWEKRRRKTIKGNGYWWSCMCVSIVRYLKDKFNKNMLFANTLIRLWFSGNFLWLIEVYNMFFLYIVWDTSVCSLFFFRNTDLLDIVHVYLTGSWKLNWSRGNEKLFSRWSNNEVMQHFTTFCSFWLWQYLEKEQFSRVSI